MFDFSVGGVLVGGEERIRNVCYSRRTESTLDGVVVGQAWGSKIGKFMKQKAKVFFRTEVKP